MCMYTSNGSSATLALQLSRYSNIAIYVRRGKAVSQVGAVPISRPTGMRGRAAQLRTGRRSSWAASPSVPTKTSEISIRIALKSLTIQQHYLSIYAATIAVLTEQSELESPKKRTLRAFIYIYIYIVSINIKVLIGIDGARHKHQVVRHHVFLKDSGDAKSLSKIAY